MAITAGTMIMKSRTCSGRSGFTAIISAVVSPAISASTTSGRSRFGTQRNFTPSPALRRA
jgi:hypothetical protein